MLVPLTIIGLLIVAFILAAGYWMWLVKDLKHRRHRAFCQLLTYLDERCQVVERLTDLVAQQIKSEQIMCKKMKELCAKTQQERKHIRKRLSLEVQFSRQIGVLVKIIQTYVSLRSNQKIMREEILLAEVEEKISSDMLLFNTLTQRYNQEIERTVMRPFAFFMKFKRYTGYSLVREE